MVVDRFEESSWVAEMSSDRCVLGKAVAVCLFARTRGIGCVWIVLARERSCCCGFVEVLNTSQYLLELDPNLKAMG